MFQSTRPMRGATFCVEKSTQMQPVSIHAPHAGRDIVTPITQDKDGVSIHAPHAGRDLGSSLEKVHLSCFNPRAPCGARPVIVVAANLMPKFQSTRPMRGATGRPRADRWHSLGFNPRAPCGARPAPCRFSRNSLRFQSTRPMRGATVGMIPL